MQQMSSAAAWLPGGVGPVMALSCFAKMIPHGGVCLLLR